MVTDNATEADVAQCKDRLVDAARKVDLLEPLRRHPFATVSVAAAIGATIAAPGAIAAARVILAPNLRSRLLSVAATQIAARLARAAHPSPDDTQPT